MIHLVLPAVLRAFTAGNDLYLAGNYQGAVAAYESAMGEASPPPELSYNLGNAYYKLGDMAHAVLYYEKTLILAPRDDDARANLKRAVEELTITEEEKVAAAGSFRPPPLVGWFTLDEVSVIFFSAYIPFTLFLFLSLITRNRWRRLSRGASLMFLVLTLILGSLPLVKYMSLMDRCGVLLGSQVDIREGPGGSAPTAGTYSGGLKVRVLESTTTAGGTWYKVELPGGRVGWVLESSLGLI